MLVTDDVLNDERFRLASDLQPLNIKLMFVTCDVLNDERSRATSFEQPSNIQAMFVTFDVSSRGTPAMYEAFLRL